MSKKNKEVLKRAGVRFLRVAGASVLALIIPSFVELLLALELNPQLQNAITAILVPLLVAGDKLAREMGFY